MHPYSINLHTNDDCIMESYIFKFFKSQLKNIRRHFHFMVYMIMHDIEMPGNDINSSNSKEFKQGVHKNKKS